jgi:hypothetical protein
MPLVVVWVLIVDVYPFLAGGLEHEFYDFPYIGNNHPNCQPTFIFFRGVGIPPTS